MSVTVNYKDFEIVLSPSDTKIVGKRGEVLYHIENKNIPRDLLVSSIVMWFRVHKDKVGDFDENELRNLITSGISELNKKPEKENKTVWIEDSDFVEIVRQINAENPFNVLVEKKFNEQLRKCKKITRAAEKPLLTRIALFGDPFRSSILNTIFNSGDRFKIGYGVLPDNIAASVITRNRIILNKGSQCIEYMIKNQMFPFRPILSLPKKGIYSLDYTLQQLLRGKTSYVVFVVPETSKRQKTFNVVLDYVVNNFKEALIFVFTTFGQEQAIKPIRDDVVKFLDSNLSNDRRKRVEIMDVELFSFVELKQVLDRLNTLQIDYCSSSNINETFFEDILDTW